MKFLKKIFSLNGRLNRKEYLFLGVLPMVGTILLFVLSTFQNLKSAVLLYLGPFIFLLVWILVLISAVKRGRDSGLNGIMTLFLFISVPMLTATLSNYVGIYTPYVLVIFFIYLLSIPSSSKELKNIGKIEYAFTIIFMGLASMLWIDFAVPNTCIESDNWKKNLTCTTMSGNAQALKMFKLDNGVYPSTNEGNEALASNPDVLKYPNYASTSYLEYLPTDPWGTKIIYVKTKDGFELISYGADKKEGGEDEYADIFYSGCGKR